MIAAAFITISSSSSSNNNRTPIATITKILSTVSLVLLLTIVTVSSTRFSYIGPLGSLTPKNGFASSMPCYKH